MQSDKRPRLAIITTHPTQYNSPWFQWMAGRVNFGLKVFYLWDFGVTSHRDPGFGIAVEWDIPLLHGYDHEFVPNLSRLPGTDRFDGIFNPTLKARLRAYRPHAALLIGYRYRSLFRLIYQHKRGFPLIFRGDSHRLGQARHGVRERLRAKTIASVYKRFSALLYVGRANYEYFRTHEVPESKLFFSPHAVDNDRFVLTPELSKQSETWRRELGIPADDLVVMFAGKFEPIKHPFDLLEAFRLLGQKGTSLLFVGAGELEAELRARATTVPNVFFAPFQNQSQMPRTYGACDLFALPSCRESWGLSINEALCLAKPVIVSNHVGCGPDLVRSHQNGLIFPAGNIPALSKSLREALSDRDRLRRWGNFARGIVSRYSYESATEGLKEALASALGQFE